jgi:hypothetical protein
MHSIRCRQASITACSARLAFILTQKIAFNPTRIAIFLTAYTLKDLASKAMEYGNGQWPRHGPFAS